MAQNATFTLVHPVPPSGTVPYVTQFSDISNGGKILGNFYDGKFRVGFTWDTSTNAQKNLPGLEPFSENYGLSMTSDGSVIVGLAKLNQTVYPVYWVNEAEPVKLFELPIGFAHGIAVAIADDALTVAGELMEQSAFPSYGTGWVSSLSGAPQLVGGLPGGDGRSSFLDLSADGRIGFGAAIIPQGLVAVHWTDKAGLQSIGDIFGGGVDAAMLSCSSDGRVAVGFGNDGRRQIVRWTQLHGLNKLPEAVPSSAGGRAFEVSGDGWRVVSVEGIFAVGNRAVIWDPVHGSRMLQDELEQIYGINLGNWILSDARSISDNGRFITGQMYNPITSEIDHYVVELPAFCYADCNNDKTLDIFDYLCFTQEFDKRSIYANCDNDGYMNIFDYICFGNQFAAGCGQ